jgi:hypothetical protein
MPGLLLVLFLELFPFGDILQNKLPNSSKIGYLLRSLPIFAINERDSVCSHKKKIPTTENRFVRYPYQFRSVLIKGINQGK